METTLAGACNAAGIPKSHGNLIQGVADALNYYILFRECGKQNVGLIEEHYAMKSSRLHAKSCDWGPMAGFVCMDPRLNKKAGDAGTLGLNKRENEAALAGAAEYVDPSLGVGHETHVSDEWVRRWRGGRSWKGGYGPIIISDARKQWLEANRLIATLHSTWVSVPGQAGRYLKAHSGDATKNGVTVRYRLVEYPIAELRRMGLASGPGGVYACSTYWAIQILDTRNFRQLQDGGALAGHSLEQRWKGAGGWTWLLGMTNPTPSLQDYGFKACVTGDYDLFSVWPLGRHYEGHTAGGLQRGPDGRWRWRGNTRWGQDARIVSKGFREPIITGNMTGRLASVKDRINQALRSIYHGGDCVYHSDEVGNPGGLAKPLAECFPMVGFAPRGAAFGPIGRRGSALNGARAFGLYAHEERLFARICADALEMGYRPDLKAPWLDRLKSFDRRLERAQL